MTRYPIRDRSRIIQDAIIGIFQEQQPRLTVRQLYYALTVRGVVPKTEGGYRQTCYQLTQMREHGTIPYGWIADNTRWQIRPLTHCNVQEALTDWQSSYRRDLWLTQPEYLEIWIEKDALAGVVSPITEAYDVPLMVCRGYSSSTFLYEAAEDIKATGKSAWIYHFGDYDPSGVDAAENVRKGLLAHGAQIHFVRMAVTTQQIEAMGLPTRPTKQKDPRSRAWGDRPSAELDAIPAPALREMVRECIERHLDRTALVMTKRIEAAEKRALADYAGNFVLAQDSDGGVA